MDATELLGRTLLLPARDAPQIVLDAKTRAALPTQVHGGVLWVCAAPCAKDAPPLVDLARFAHTAPSVITTKLVHASYDQTVLGFVDAAHVPVVHSAWWWRKQDRPRKVKQKHYAPMAYGFRMRAHDAKESADLYKVLGNNVDVTIDFCLPGIRTERIETDRLAVFNVTCITPIGPRLCALTNFMYTDSILFHLASPFLHVFGDNFLEQDKRILDMTCDHFPGASRALFIGDPDQPSKWYYALKRELERAQCSSTAFVNPVEPAVLSWQT